MGLKVGVSNRQLFVLGWIYFAYVLCYLLRKNFPLLLPGLAEQGLLTTAQAGTVASTFETVVGIVKFFCGAFVDGHDSPAQLLSQTLLVASISSIFVFLVFNFLQGSDDYSTTLRVMLVALFWSCNGAGQAVAWPALARVFMNWFPEPSTRGFWYSILATNQNLGGAIAPRMYPPLIIALGWQAALIGPAALAFVFAMAMMFMLQSAPSRVSSETVEQGKTTPALDHTTKPQQTQTPKLPPTSFAKTFATLIRMPSFLCLCFAYIPIMMIRISLANWTAIIFLDRNLSVFEAGACMSALEIGGFVGGLIGGILSDNLFGGRRGPIMCIFSLLCTPISLGYQSVMNMDLKEISIVGVPVPRIVVLQIIYFLVGVCSFPPHSLIGLTAREIVPENMRSTAGCVAKAVGQIGAAAGGFPLEQLAQAYGWGCVGYVNAACGIISALIFLPLWNKTTNNKND
eukprot:m.96261 g.96261  ORF g.96261 m.96261 type:complete len:457 (+) comp26880_c0_seq1:92-1462(+)